MQNLSVICISQYYCITIVHIRRKVSVHFNRQHDTFTFTFNFMHTDVELQWFYCTKYKYTTGLVWLVFVPGGSLIVVCVCVFICVCVC